MNWFVTIWRAIVVGERKASDRRQADLLALLIVAAIGMPAVYIGAQAFADGEVRRREVPIRALVGSDAFDLLTRGEDHPQHYIQRPPIAPTDGMTVFDSENDRLAPSFTLRRADGSAWRLEDHRGKVVVMNFWSVTCPPCLEEMPSLISLARILEEHDDVVLVTVAADQTWDQVRTVVPDDSDLTVLLDSDRSIVGGLYGSRQFPETWIIDPDGIIRLRIDGQRDWSSALALEVMEAYL